MQETSAAYPLDQSEEYETNVKLLIEHSTNCKMLKNWLENKYTNLRVSNGFSDTRDDDDVDMLVVDYQGFYNNLEHIVELKTEREELLPLLMLDSKDKYDNLPSGHWELIDEVIPIPVRKRELEKRIQSQLKVHRLYKNVQDEKKAHQISKRRYKGLLEFAPDAVTIADLDGNIQFANKKAVEMFGYTQTALHGMNVEKLIPERCRQKFRTYKEQFIEAAQMSEVEDEIELMGLTKDGREFPTEVMLSTFAENGETIQVMGMIRDISQRKKFEEKLKKSLDEKVTLLKEIHHRVKNNLAVTTGLLELEKENAENEETRKILNDAQLRIYSMAAVHEQLYQSDDFSSIGLKEYVDELISTIGDVHVQETGNIEIEKNVDEVALDISQAVPCGLILNELIVNAYKHAFEGQKQGRIEIDIYSDEEKIVMKVTDNGVGLPDDFDLENSRSMGLTLINTLARQLQADIDYNTNDQTEFNISFIPE